MTSGEFPNSDVELSSAISLNDPLERFFGKLRLETASGKVASLTLLCVVALTARSRLQLNTRHASPILIAKHSSINTSISNTLIEYISADAGRKVYLSLGRSLGAAGDVNGIYNPNPNPNPII